MAENSNDHQDLDEARAALERLEAQLRELDELSKEIDNLDAESSFEIETGEAAVAPIAAAPSKPIAPQAPATQPVPEPKPEPKPAPVSQPAPPAKPAPPVKPPPAAPPVPAPQPVAAPKPIPAPRPPASVPPAVASAPVAASAPIAPAVIIPSLNPPKPPPPQSTQAVQPSDPSRALIRPDSVSRPVAIRQPTKPDLDDATLDDEIEDEIEAQPSVFREVRGNKSKAKSGTRRGFLPWLLALGLLAAIGFGLVYGLKQGLFNLAWESTGTTEVEDPYVPAAISLDPLPEDPIVAGQDGTSTDPLVGKIDFALEPDFIRFKQLVPLGEAMVVFQTWRLGKLTRDGEAVTGKEYVILDLRVHNKSKKKIALRKLFQETVMLDGQQRRLENLVLERGPLQGELPEYVQPEGSEHVRFVFQAQTGAGDFHLRLPGNPPRQLDLAALPAPGLAPGVVDTLFR